MLLSSLYTTIRGLSSPKDLVLALGFNRHELSIPQASWVLSPLERFIAYV